MKRLLKGKVAFVATGNIHKFNEIRNILGQHGIGTAMLQKISPLEIQDDSMENIARASAIDAVKKCNLPIIVEDAGLFIDALQGFPGPYSSYVFRTIGNGGILKLMEKVTNRSAHFKSLVAFANPDTGGQLHFTGKVLGKIVTGKKGTQGFGFDPIFLPRTSSKTFAEMSVGEKNEISHRASAFRKFAEWYS
ncbi:MAG: XTP/dITP diphosphatase [Candidatus Bathyarchaeota archaeon]|nr:XTP/dITP diphosphatase [Candidatus Bathyarchaeota archaeon]